MQLIILAGGRSTRLWPLTDKNLLIFFGKTLFEHQFQVLNKAGLRSGAIIVNPESADDIRSIVSRRQNVVRSRFQVIVQSKPDGMGHAIQIASKKLNPIEPTVMVSFNDVVPEATFKDFLSQVRKYPNDYHLTGQKVDSYFPGGYLKLKGLRIIGIVEKPMPGKVPSQCVNLVIHYWPQLGEMVAELDKFPVSQTHYEESLAALMQKSTFRLFKYSGDWFPIKYPWHVLDVMNYFFDRQGAKKVAKNANVFIHKSAVVEGPVWMEDGVKIMAGAVVKGPVYLGKNVIVANHALVRSSHIGAHSVIGFSTEIARSYLGEHVWTHSNYIGDSVIGNRCSFGAGCITGNLRLDEQLITTTIKGERINTGRTKYGLITGEGIRCGINTNFMPGVKIGSGTYIGAGALIASDVPNSQYVTVKQTLQVVKNQRASISQDRDQYRKQI